MKRVLDFEYLTGGGAVDGAETGRQTLLQQGHAKRDAMGISLQHHAGSAGLPARRTGALVHVRA